MKTSKSLLLVSIVLLVLSLFTACEESFTTPKDLLISDKEAKEMRTNYVENQYQFIVSGLKDRYGEKANGDYTNFTIELADLENYIAYAKNEAKNGNYNNLGFRIELAAKKDTETKVPYTDIYYQLIGDKISKEKTQKGSMLPVLSKTTIQAERTLVPNTTANRVGKGGNPPD